MLRQAIPAGCRAPGFFAKYQTELLQHWNAAAALSGGCKDAWRLASSRNGQAMSGKGLGRQFLLDAGRQASSQPAHRAAAPLPKVGMEMLLQLCLEVAKKPGASHPAGWLSSVNNGQGQTTQQAKTVQQHRPFPLPRQPEPRLKS